MQISKCRYPNADIQMQKCQSCYRSIPVELFPTCPDQGSIARRFLQFARTIAILVAMSFLSSMSPLHAQIQTGTVDFSDMVEFKVGGILGFFDAVGLPTSMIPGALEAEESSAFATDVITISQRMDDSLCDEEVWVHVHGFNVTSDQAEDSLQTVATGLDAAGFSGTLLGFSWNGNPGTGIAGFEIDEQHFLACENAADHYATVFANFLRYLKVIWGSRINISAHSLGNRVVLMGLEALAEQAVNDPGADDTLQCIFDVHCFSAAVHEDIFSDELKGKLGHGPAGGGTGAGAPGSGGSIGTFIQFKIWTNPADPILGRYFPMASLTPFIEVGDKKHDLALGMMGPIQNLYPDKVLPYVSVCPASAKIETDLNYDVPFGDPDYQDKLNAKSHSDIMKSQNVWICIGTFLPEGP